MLTKDELEIFKTACLTFPSESEEKWHSESWSAPNEIIDHQR